MKARRHEHGALDLQTLEARPVFAGDEIQDLLVDERNRAKEIIEDFMIAANGVTARFLHGKKIPSLRRMVRSPKRWGRIVEIAAQHNSPLPPEPDSRALEAFLATQKAADPLRFPDLSLSVIKLLGPGEYVVELPEEEVPGPLRTCGQRLYALNGSQPTVSGSDYPAHPEGSPGRVAHVLQPGGTGGFGPALHGEGK